MTSLDNTTSSSHENHNQQHKEKTGTNFDWNQYVKDFPMETLLASHRKNMDAVRQAQQTATELVRDLVQLNNQHMRHAFDDMCHYTRTAFSSHGTTNGFGNTHASLLADTVRASFDRGIAHTKQVTDLFSTSTSKVFNTYRERFDDAMKEAQKMGTQETKA